MEERHEYNDEDLLMLSVVQHFVFCRRQWSLIHLEQQWEENVKTIEGQIIHEKCHDTEFTECRNNLLIVRGLYFTSYTLGLSGQCDVTEFRKRKDNKGASLYGHEGTFDIYPVEYKRGKAKKGNEDIFQLCAQALCLEELFSCQIPEGALYYAETKRREKVLFTEDLRAEVKKTILEMHEYYRKRTTPKVKTTRKCKSCSLKEICLPLLCKRISVKEYYTDIEEG